MGIILSQHRVADLLGLRHGGQQDSVLLSGELDGFQVVVVMANRTEIFLNTRSAVNTELVLYPKMLSQEVASVGHPTTRTPLEGIDEAFDQDVVVDGPRPLLLAILNEQARATLRREICTDATYLSKSNSRRWR